MSFTMVFRMWRVLRKRLHLKAYKLSVVRDAQDVLLHYDSLEHCICPLNRLCGPVVRVPGYKSRRPGSIPGAIRLSVK
jgi:hypothetical protein